MRLRNLLAEPQHQARLAACKLALCLDQRTPRSPEQEADRAADPFLSRHRKGTQAQAAARQPQPASAAAPEPVSVPAQNTAAAVHIEPPDAQPAATAMEPSPQVLCFAAGNSMPL